VIDRNSTWYKIDFIARRATPFLLTIVLVIIAQAPLKMSGIAPVTLSVGLISVYYWALHRPSMLPVTAVFCTGLLQDILTLTPMGLGALSLVVVYGVMVSQRRLFYGKSFVFVWWGFAMTAVAVGTMRWLLVSLIEGNTVLFLPSIIECVLTVTLYPVFGYFFVVVHRSLLQEH